MFGFYHYKGHRKLLHYNGLYKTKCKLFKVTYCIFFIHTSIGGALTVILYFLVVWLRAIFSSTQTAVIFGDKNTSKWLTNLFLVVEQTNRISLASFSDLQCHARDQSCCLSGVVFKKLRDQTISKCLYYLFLAVERTHKISLVGFSDLQCVVYVTFHNKFSA